MATGKAVFGLFSLQLLLLLSASCDGSVLKKNSHSNSKPDSNDVNIRNPQPVQLGTTHYEGYYDFMRTFKKSLNLEADPCEDFYEYSCGNFRGFDVLEDAEFANYVLMAKQMMNTSYVANAPKPVKQMVVYYNKCLYSLTHWNMLVAKGEQVNEAMNTIMNGDPSDPVRQKKTAGNPFPMLQQDVEVKEFPDKLNMGFLLGYPVGMGFMGSLVAPKVDSNYVDQKKGYALYVDQPTMSHPHKSYTHLWKNAKAASVAEMIGVMNLLAEIRNVTLNQTRLQEDAVALIDFDYQLAMTFCSPPEDRRNVTRFMNPMTLSEIQSKYNNIDWEEFFRSVLQMSSDAVKATIGNSNYQYYVMEPERIQMINDALVPGNKYGVNPATVLNLVYYRVLMSNADFMPWELPINSPEHVSFARSIRRPHGQSLRKQENDADLAAHICAGETMNKFPIANARVFIDNVFPTEESRTTMRNNIAKITNGVATGFRSMIDGLDWMTAESKKGAYSKIENMVTNIAYTDLITDDAQLTEYYKNLDIEKDDDYFTMVNKEQAFTHGKIWGLLTQKKVNRQLLRHPLGSSNAWYEPSVNSVTVPAGLLRQPIYDANWPSAVNFGALGTIIAHEIIHAFDNMGVQFNQNGELGGWMASSQKSFDEMNNCVIREYNDFCPYGRNKTGDIGCVDAEKTQGENIADNAGVQAAFRAYRSFVSFNGPEPRLPDDLFQEFTSDQLFFLSFARNWCENPKASGEVIAQFLEENHPPGKYRVLGSLQNFPAFKDAFNCPVSTYAPEKHCNVYVSDASTAFGVPKNNSN